MNRIFGMKSVTLVLGAALAAATPAAATTVLATASVYNTGAGSTQRTTFDITGATSLTLAATGKIIITPGYSNGPDGNGSLAITHNVSGANGLSGISLPTGYAGALVAVFLGPTDPLPSAIAPAPLAYDVAGLGLSNYSPLLDQVFFAGDGLTGTGTGASQIFYVPTGATRIAFGIADSDNYKGAPGAYFDNSLSFDVSVTPTFAAASVPEPSSWLMMVAGFGTIGWAARRRTTMRITSAR